MSIEVLNHHHPLRPAPWFSHGLCGGCKKTGHIYNGYRCADSECHDFLYHKECAEASPVINHPSHPKHPLHLEKYFGRSKCPICGSGTGTYHLSNVGYSCSQCIFYIDLECSRKSQPPYFIQAKSHKHTLVLLTKKIESGQCEVCRKTVVGKNPYACFLCKVFFHLDCVHLSPEVNHHSHPNHPLALLTTGAPDYTDNTCILCGRDLEEALRHCSICNFSICFDCAKDPPPPALLELKTHEHQLILLPRQISFTCNACGMQGDRSPYYCTQCNFMVHRDCIGLPHVININRHDHRISRTNYLSPGVWSCGVCRQSVNRFCGAYSCSVCSSYVVHSQCATRHDVWDGVELEGIPEEAEDIMPFKVVGDNLIRHFSHEHNLRLGEEHNTRHDERKRCQACIRPIYPGPVYSCERCNFFLHEVCANLHLKKRLVFHNNPFKLKVMGAPVVLSCGACKGGFHGFSYRSPNFLELDVRCSLVSEPYVYEGHLHPLYFGNKGASKCEACDEVIEGIALYCDDCNFVLGFCCAVLPKTVRHKCDDHPLFLSYGEKASGKYWCDICEEETDSKKWFYTCADCGVTLHIKCVLGDFLNLMPGTIFEERRYSMIVVVNDRSFRPFCGHCKMRCKCTIIVKVRSPFNVFMCSYDCLYTYLIEKNAIFYS
ncbi:hypothetical protein EUTSA_v10012912mg [Eutrema salsugineum]|uniref:Phorbol-ester/DAG-type domain-containing protein n=1 Tax=Eutrema salsugineum TaxID=72664 RepID=V4LM54_EUTSA|nr:uncharacterized protein LOC18018049 [Eutrema salsugineum]ESQ43502.1 hypothetical protein EUTSA_v10012912mg [Eutrema salsugineum]